MSDIGFLLLIFIMLVSLINYRKEVNIQYPLAETGGRVNAEHNLEIWIDRDGGVYLGGNPSSLALIEQNIAQVNLQAPDTLVHIIADRDTPFENVHVVLNILQNLQYRVVSFVVKNEYLPVYPNKNNCFYRGNNTPHNTDHVCCFPFRNRGKGRGTNRGRDETG
jgi:biopolymer transport protein ExbD